MKANARGVLDAAKGLSSGEVIAIGISYTLLVGTLDVLMPRALSFGPLYLLGIAFVAWGAGPRPAIMLAAGCAGIMSAHEWGGASGSGFPLILVLNGLSHVIIFCAVGWLIARLVRLTRELKGRVEERTGQYHTMLATVMDGFTLIEGGRFTECNDAFCRMLGYGREELLGMGLAEIELKESPSDVEQHLQRIRQAGGDRFETRLRHKDGNVTEVEVSVSRLPGVDGVLMAFCREIGRRKQAEAQLRESQERYRSLAESSPDAIFIVDRDVRIQYANSAAAAVWGRKPDELVGISQGELFSPETAERHMNSARRVLETGEPMRMDERVANRWFEARIVPVRGPSGQVHSLIVIAVDISERKRNESLLKAQRDVAQRLSLTSDLNTALNALLDVAIQLDGIDCGGVYLSDQRNGELKMEASRGLSEEFVREHSFYPATSERAKLVARGEPVYHLYLEFPATNSGSPEELQAVAVLPMRHEGLVVGCLNLGSHTHKSIPLQSRMGMETLAALTAGAIARIRAENDRHRLEQQMLEIADREQARIGQELHDGLCQQLVSLAFDANSVASRLGQSNGPEAVTAARIAEYLDQAITEARQLSRGLFPVKLEAEGLPSAFQELARATQVRYGVPCEAICDEPLELQNAAMAVHLYRIAQEAVTNAVKHAHATRIAIRLESSGRELKLEVEDDGIGFGQKRAEQMTGMGLHIMEYRARSIGGALRFGPAIHGGTTVSCCIPCPEPQKLDL